MKERAKPFLDNVAAAQSIADLRISPTATDVIPRSFLAIQLLFRGECELVAISRSRHRLTVGFCTAPTVFNCCHVTVAVNHEGSRDAPVSRRLIAVLK